MNTSSRRSGRAPNPRASGAILTAAVWAVASVVAAQGADRYGPDLGSSASGPLVYATPGSRYAVAPATPIAMAAPTTPAPAPTAPRRMLSWSGKTASVAPSVVTALAYTPPTPERRVRAAPEPEPAPARAPPSNAPVPATRAALGPPVRPWTQRYDSANAATPALTQTPRVAASTPGGARYYSLHSAYGMTPDPAPIPPQFFGPTADMTAAETTDPVRRASATTAAASTTSAINAARLANEAQ